MTNPLPPFKYNGPAEGRPVTSHNPKKTVVDLYSVMRQVEAITNYLNEQASKKPGPKPKTNPES